MLTRSSATTLGAVIAMALSACGPSSGADDGALASAIHGSVPDEKKLDLSLCDPSQGGFTFESTNPYFPLGIGSEWVLEGEEDDEQLENIITVLDETEIVAGVTTRVVEERESVDDELAEVSRNFFAVASDGTVCYFGEEVDIYEDGEIVSHEGAWRADDPGNAPGIIMPADPFPGVKFQMEAAPGVAEDTGKIVGIGPVSVPAGDFDADDTIRVQERNPLDGDKGFKIYVAGVGIVVDGTLVLTSYDIAP